MRADKLLESAVGHLGVIGSASAGLSDPAAVAGNAGLIASTPNARAPDLSAARSRLKSFHSLLQRCQVAQLRPGPSLLSVRCISSLPQGVS